MISKDEVIHVAKLARLELTVQEVEKMQKDLSSILDYFNVLKGASETPGEKHEDLHKSAKNGLRRDEVVQKPANLASNLIQAAPDKKSGYIKVRQVL